MVRNRSIVVAAIVLSACFTRERREQNLSQPTSQSDTEAHQRKVQGEFNAVETRTRAKTNNCLRTWKAGYFTKNSTHLDLFVDAQVLGDGSVGEVKVRFSDGTRVAENLESCVSMALHKEQFEYAENKNRVLTFDLHLY